MSNMSSDPQYSGPSSEFTPSPYGGYPESITSRVTRQSLNAKRGDNFIKTLDEVIETTSDTIKRTESYLGQFSLKIQPGSNLSAAQASEWPTELGTPKDHVTYEQYKALSFRSTRSSDFIKKEYEDSIRGVSGTNAMDILGIAFATLNEALNMKKFYTDYMGELNDESALKTLELFHTWAKTALYYSRVFWDVFESRKTYQLLASSEIQSLTPAQAGQFQAVFQVKLNALNIELNKTLQKIKNDCVTLSNTYYFKFLGPALKLKLNAVNKLSSYYNNNSQLSNSLGSSLDTLGMNIQVLITDQMRRNDSYKVNIGLALSLLADRDTYVSYIRQLQYRGKEYDVKFSKNIEVSESEKESFKKIIDNSANRNTFVSSHDALDGVDTGVHPLHLLKDGDTIRGDLHLKAGVKIDGVVPSTHQHTGADGSARIHGSSIQPNSVSEEVVDVSQTPSQPESLSLYGKTLKITTPGVPLVDAVLSWEGEDGYTYEVSITEDVP